MPVTARLSLKFYERFGEDIAQELVNWFNQVDATYRDDLKSLNELNFARFDAKVEQRFAESEARLERRLADLEAKFARRTADLEAKVEKRFAEAAVALEQRLTGMEKGWNERFGQLQAEMHRGLRDVKVDMIKWMFIFVAGGTATVLSVLLTALR